MRIDKAGGGWGYSYVGRACMENINGMSGSGVSLKTSTFLLVLMRFVLEQAAWRHRCKARGEK